MSSTTTTPTIKLEREGNRVYLVGLPFALKDKAKEVLGMNGKNFDIDRKVWWVGVAKLADAEKFVAELAASPAPATPAGPTDDSRVRAKVSYKGRNYFVIGETGDRCYLTILDGTINFWTNKSECELVRTYEPREVRSGYGRSTRTEYTTLGSLRRFVDKQKRLEASGADKCPACGKFGTLVDDLEDGLRKCKGCCDMPAD